MSDRAKWKVRGRVRTLRAEFAEWDPRQEVWQAPRRVSSVTFHPNGTIRESEHQNPDASISRSTYLYDDVGRLVEVQFWMNDGPMSKVLHSYDDAGRPLHTVNVAQDRTVRESETYRYDGGGRKTKVQLVDCANCFYGFEGTEHAYGAPGAATMTVTYDERDQPADVLFHDPDHNLLQRVVFTRDRDGRLVSEEIVRGELLQNALDSAPPEERARANALLATVFGPDQTLSRTTYAYDQRGRRVERRTRMGTLGENRTTFRYDDYDNPVEETTEDRSREVNIDENGIEEVTAETVQR